MQGILCKLTQDEIVKLQIRVGIMIKKFKRDTSVLNLVMVVIWLIELATIVHLVHIPENEWDNTIEGSSSVPLRLQDTRVMETFMDLKGLNVEVLKKYFIKVNRLRNLFIHNPARCRMSTFISTVGNVASDDFKELFFYCLGDFYVKSDCEWIYEWIKGEVDTGYVKEVWE